MDELEDVIKRVKGTYENQDFSRQVILHITSTLPSRRPRWYKIQLQYSYQFYYGTVNEIYRYKENKDISQRAKVLQLKILPRSFHRHLYIFVRKWEKLGHTNSVYTESWPTYDESVLVKDEVETVIRINES